MFAASVIIYDYLQQTTFLHDANLRLTPGPSRDLASKYLKILSAVLPSARLQRWSTSPSCRLSSGVQRPSKNYPRCSSGWWSKGRWTYAIMISCWARLGYTARCERSRWARACGGAISTLGRHAQPTLYASNMRAAKITFILLWLDCIMERTTATYSSRSWLFTWRAESNTRSTSEAYAWNMNG